MCNTCPRRPSEWLGAAICWENLFWEVWITVKTWCCSDLDAVHLKLNNKGTFIPPTWAPFVTFNWLHRAAFFLSSLEHFCFKYNTAKTFGEGQNCEHFHRHLNDYYFSHSMTAVISPYFWMSPFEKKRYTSLYNFGHHFVWKTHKNVSRRADTDHERWRRSVFNK